MARLELLQRSHSLMTLQMKWWVSLQSTSL